MSAADALAYSVGDKVLCSHSNVFYKARVVKLRDAASGVRVHYDGWRARYDEWVETSRLLPYTQANVDYVEGLLQAQEEARKEAERAKQAAKEAVKRERQEARQAERDARRAAKEAERQQKQAERQAEKEKRAAEKAAEKAERDALRDRAAGAKRAASLAGDGRTSSGGGGSHNARRAARGATGSNSSKRFKPNDGGPMQLTVGKAAMAAIAARHAAQHAKLRMPEPLQAVLAVDAAAITLEKQLVPLPRKPSVTSILKAFADTLEADEAEAAAAMVIGVSATFCQALGPLLLYSFERAQYADLLERHSLGELADIYGGEHLLRLLQKMPDLIEKEASSSSSSSSSSSRSEKSGASGSKNKRGSSASTDTTNRSSSSGHDSFSSCTSQQVDKAQMAEQRALLVRLLDFICDHRGDFLKPVYENCTPPYLRLCALAGL
eukprot:UC1_evm1s1674